MVQRAVEGGVEVLVVTQRAGFVDLGMYQNGQVLADAGAIPGGELSLEAATAKLMCALGRYPDREDRRAWLVGDVAGELI